MEERVKELERQVTTLTQALDSLHLQLNNKVDKNKVIAAINLSDEGIKIIGERIYLDCGTMIGADFKMCERGGCDERNE